MADPTIGFLAWRMAPDGSDYSGGVLVTGLDGVPLEFRHTHRLRPTLFQRILYGKSLAPHVLFDLIGARLIDSLRVKPDCLLVEARMGLALAKSIALPLAAIRPPKNGAGRDVALDLGFEGGAVNSAVTSTSGRDVDLEMAEGAPGDLQELRVIIAAASQNIDPFEPFERIATALKEADSRLKAG